MKQEASSGLSNVPAKIVMKGTSNMSLNARWVDRGEQRNSGYATRMRVALRPKVTTPLDYAHLLLSS